MRVLTKLQRRGLSQRAGLRVETDVSEGTATSTQSSNTQAAPKSTVSKLSFNNSQPFPWHCLSIILVELVRNLVAHGGAREGKWRGNWRMEWVASTLTLPRNVVHPALLPLMCTSRLPAVTWTDAPTDLNGLVRFRERWNLVSARVPSRSARATPASLVTSFIPVSGWNWSCVTSGFWGTTPPI